MGLIDRYLLEYEQDDNLIDEACEIAEGILEESGCYLNEDGVERFVLLVADSLINEDFEPVEQFLENLSVLDEISIANIRKFASGVSNNVNKIRKTSKDVKRTINKVKKVATTPQVQSTIKDIKRTSRNVAKTSKDMNNQAKKFLKRGIDRVKNIGLP